MVLHVAASLDARIDRIGPELNRFSRLASGFREDAVLTGDDTLLEAPYLRAEDDLVGPSPEDLLGGGGLSWRLTTAVDASPSETGCEGSRHGVRRIRVGSGGASSGALLRAGLLDEVSVPAEPVLAGGARPRTVLRGPDPSSFADGARLDLAFAQQFDDGVAWLRRRVGE